MLITEAASDAAAAGIHLGDIGARYRPQQLERIGCAPKRFLMAMPVQ